MKMFRRASFPLVAALALLFGVLGALASAPAGANGTMATQTIIISSQPAYGNAPGQPISLIAQVTPLAPGPAVTGSVQYFSQVKGQPKLHNLGNAPVGANGLSFFTISGGLNQNEYELVAVYSGDVNYASSTGSTSYLILNNCSTGQFPSQTQGNPIVHPNDRLGYYIGQSNGQWELFTSKPDHGPGNMDIPGVLFTGTIKTNGRFVNVAAVRNEGQDSVTEGGEHDITFHFRTHLSMDELTFFPVCGSWVSFTLSIEGAPATTTQIFLGNPASSPTGNPFQFMRS
jgi:Bacterial Ig-like domain (group 3)